MKNIHSLPHVSQGTPEKHIDITVEYEGGTMKVHEILPSGRELAPPTSLQGLRDRLSSQKGY